MKFLALVWANLKRKKLRTALTLLSIFVAFLLFGFLCAIKEALRRRRQHGRAGPAHRAPQGLAHPDAAGELQEPRSQPIPGVAAVCHQTWFGGIYQDPKNFFATIPGRARGIPRHVPGVRAHGLGETGMARDPHRRHRRPHDGGPLQVEDRRPHPAHIADLGPARRADAVGV